MGARLLLTRRGVIRLPACFPVTTFGERYPLDGLIRPYLGRLAPGVMVAWHYARRMQEPPRLPVLIDSGGFASLLPGAAVQEQEGLGVLQSNGEQIHPRDVLDLQEEKADVAFTLDFPIPPGLEAGEARRRQELTIANAHWALANRRRRDLPLFACVQGWDEDSAQGCARAYAGAGFDGLALGGMVPRLRDLDSVVRTVEAVRAEAMDLPLHVFGVGKPGIIERVLAAGADSVDSSSYVKLAAQGRLWGRPHFRLADPSPTDRLHLALCNLAAACGRALPLPLAEVLFATCALPVEETGAVDGEEKRG